MCKIEASTFLKALRSSYIIVTLLSQYVGEVKILTDDAALASPPRTLAIGHIMCNSKHSHVGQQNKGKIFMNVP